MPIALASLSICIALAAFTVAFLNFRLSRFPHVRLTFRVYAQGGPEGVGTFFDVEVDSWGLPIWDMKVRLEGDYRGDYCRELGQYAVEFEPVGSIPNPMNPGQVAKFRLAQEFVQRINSGTTFDRKYGLSDLPPNRVAVCVYGSGERLIKRVSADKFKQYGFWSFDTLKKSEVSK